MKPRGKFFTITVYLLAIAMIFMGVPVSAITIGDSKDNDDDTIIDMAEYLVPDGFELSVNGTTYRLNEHREFIDDDGNITSIDVSVNDTISVRLAFSAVPIRVNQEIHYVLPEGFLNDIFVTESETPIMDGLDNVGTTYVYTNGLIKFIPTSDYITTHSNDEGIAYIGGTVMINGSVKEHSDNSKVSDGKVDFGSFEITLPFNYDDFYSDIQVHKTNALFDPVSKTLTYTVTVKNIGDTVANNVIVVDEFTKSAEYIKKFTDSNKFYTVLESIDESINPSMGTVLQDDDTPKLVWLVGSIDSGVSESLTYTAKLSADYFSQEVAPTVENTATATWGAYGIHSYTTSDTFSGVVNISKTHEDSFVADDGSTHIRYTVTVSTPDTNKVNIDNVTVDDVIAEDCITEYSTVTPCEDTTVTIDIAKRTINWDIGTMKPNKTKQLTYEIVVKEDYFTSKNTSTKPNEASVTKEINNLATVRIGGREYAHCNDIYILTKKWLTKDGDLQDDGSFVFNIVVNQLDSTISPFHGINTIEDTITGAFEFSGDITITVTDAHGNKVGTLTDDISKYITNTKENTQTFSINLTDENFKVTSPTGEKVSAYGAYQYNVTYTATPIDPTVKVIRNSATATIGDGSDENHITIGSQPSFTGVYNYYFDMGKSFVGGNLDNIKWKTTIKTPIPAGSLFKDFDPTEYPYDNSKVKSNNIDVTEHPNYEWFANETINFTQEQLDNIVVTDGDGNVIPKDDYTVTYIENNISTSGNAVRGFRILFNKDIEKAPITIEYAYTINPTNLTSDEQVGEYKNRSKLEIYGINKTVATSLYYKYYHELKKSPAGVDWSNDTVKWYIELNHGSTISGDGTLKELIPQGLEFVSAEIVERGTNAQNTQISQMEITEEEPSDSHRQNENIGKYIYIPITGLSSTKNIENLPYDTKHYANPNYKDDGYIKILITTKIVDEQLLSKKSTYNALDDTVTQKGTWVTNRVEFYQEDPTNPYRAYADQEIVSQSLTKSVNIDYSNRPYITYTIDVNNASADILPNSDYITIVDEMSSNMNLAFDPEHKLTVTQADGTDISNDCELTIINDGHGFSIKVPDSEHLTITYYVTVLGYVNQTIDEVYNTIHFENSNANVDSIIKNFVIKDSGATAYAENRGTFTILKLDTKGNIIPNVTFELSRVLFDDDGLPQTNDENQPLLELVEQQTTNEDGMIRFYLGRDYENQIYMLQEVSAPNQYVMDDSQHYISFKDNESFSETFNNIPVEGIANNSIVYKYNELKNITTEQEKVTTKVTTAPRIVTTTTTTISDVTTTTTPVDTTVTTEDTTTISDITTTETSIDTTVTTEDTTTISDITTTETSVDTTATTENTTTPVVTTTTNVPVTTTTSNTSVTTTTPVVTTTTTVVTTKATTVPETTTSTSKVTTTPVVTTTENTTPITTTTTNIPVTTTTVTTTPVVTTTTPVVTTTETTSMTTTMVTTVPKTTTTNIPVTTTTVTTVPETTTSTSKVETTTTTMITTTNTPIITTTIPVMTTTVTTTVTTVPETTTTTPVTTTVTTTPVVTTTETSTSKVETTKATTTLITTTVTTPLVTTTVTTTPVVTTTTPVVTTTTTVTTVPETTTTTSYTTVPETTITTENTTPITTTTTVNTVPETTTSKIETTTETSKVETTTTTPVVTTTNIPVTTTTVTTTSDVTTSTSKVETATTTETSKVTTTPVVTTTEDTTTTTLITTTTVTTVPETTTTTSYTTVTTVPETTEATFATTPETTAFATSTTTTNATDAPHTSDDRAVVLWIILAMSCAVYTAKRR